jgi:hypothetical protein
MPGRIGFPGKWPENHGESAFTSNSATTWPGSGRLIRINEYHFTIIGFKALTGPR